MKISFRTRLLSLLSLFFLIAVLNAVMVFVLERAAEQKLQWVVHTHEVLKTSYRLIGALKDAETGQRGYLLTQKVSYLEPYHQGVDQVEAQKRALKRLTRDNPVQQARLDEIEKLIQKKLDELESTIQYMQQGQKEKALALVREDIGKRYMDQLRTLIGEFMQHETLLLEARKGDYREIRTQVVMVLLFEVFVVIVLFIFILVFLRRNLMQPLQAMLNIVKSTQENRRAQVGDIVPQDEIGYLMASVFEMNHVVVERTKKLKHKATRDPLTGLMNRVALFDALPEYVRMLQTGQQLALLYLDLNKFKPVNDQLGHETGDALLRQVAQRLQAQLRGEDAIFRLGGDEFVILLPFVRREELDKVLARLCDTMKTPFEFSGERVEVGVSIGVAVASDKTAQPEGLLRLADQAMYRAKQTGQCFSFSDDGDT